MRRFAAQQQLILASRSLHPIQVLPILRRHGIMNKALLTTE
jgi:hypothetical protein